MGRTEFVRVDLRDPLIAKVISSAKVDTVVHAAMTANSRYSGGRGSTGGPRRSGHSTIKEMNVIGTMQLLAACQKSTTMTRLVMKSTSAVYGTSPQNPAMFTEQDELTDLPTSGYAKDAAEIERYIRNFARRRGDVDVTVLRFINLIGPRIDTVLTQYFALPVVPTVKFLNYGQVLDTTRLRAEFGFTPRWTTVQAFDDFLHGRALRPVIDPKRMAGVARGLRELAARCE